MSAAPGIDRFERLPHFEEAPVLRVWHDAQLGHLAVEHDGTITLDDLQRLKTGIWGAEARAAIYFPAEHDYVAGGSICGLWRLGDTDFAPCLGAPDPLAADTVMARWATAMAGGRG